MRTVLGGRMVFKFLVITYVATATWAQPPSPLAFRQESSIPPQPVKPATPITPEMRGDIQMARKMYREAIEMYTSAGTDSAIIVNKIGIAHHQLQELEMARRCYERA